jgi:hypothetical protein
MSAAQANFEKEETEVIELRLEETKKALDFETACKIVPALAAKLEFLVQSNSGKINHFKIRGRLDIITAHIILLVGISSLIYANTSNNKKNLIPAEIIVSIFFFLLFIFYLLRAKRSFITSVDKYYEDQLISESEEILNHGHFLVEKTRLEYWQKLELSLHLQRAENALSQLRTFKKKS